MTSTDERLTKHLEMVQAIVTRMAQNSFAYKAWAVALVSAVLALGVDKTSGFFVLLALLPTLAFWGLDSYYLRQERLFRRLHDVIRGGYPDTPLPEPFCMDRKPYKDLDPPIVSWYRTFFAPTEVGLYGPMVAVIVLVSILLFVAASGHPPAAS